MLSERKKAFCRAYVVDFNGASAAITAGYSKRRAIVTASELLKDPAISEEIKNLIDKRNLKTDDAAGRVIKELEAIAYAKTTDFVKVKDIEERVGRKTRKVRIAYIELTSDVDEEKQKAIAEIRQTKDGVSLKSHDKVKALELLGRHFGIFEKDNNQSKPVVNLGNLPVTFE